MSIAVLLIISLETESKISIKIASILTALVKKMPIKVFYTNYEINRFVIKKLTQIKTLKNYKKFKLYLGERIEILFLQSHLNFMVRFEAAWAQAKTVSSQKNKLSKKFGQSKPDTPFSR